MHGRGKGLPVALLDVASVVTVTDDKEFCGNPGIAHGLVRQRLCAAADYDAVSRDRILATVFFGVIDCVSFHFCGSDPGQIGEVVVDGPTPDSHDTFRPAP